MVTNIKQAMDIDNNEDFSLCQQGNQYQFYHHQDYLRGRGFRGRPRGALRGEHRGGGPRGGPYRGSREGQRGGCREGVGYQYPGQQGNLSAQGYPAENKRRPMRGPRGVRRGWPRRGPWDGSAQNQGGYGCYVSHNQGRARHHVPLYLEDLEEASETYRWNEEVDVYLRDASQHAKDVNIGHYQGNQRGSRGKRGRGQRGMRRSQSMSCAEANQGYGNENDERFEEKKLVICGLNAATTNESVVNFIEAMSGEEVKEVTMLGEAKALVTMAEPITNFGKIKTKGEQRGLDSAKLSIERVPICKSILVSGISDDTTHDAIELFFESPRNNGGPVEKVRFQPESGSAVVVFQDPKAMEGVLAKQQEKPLILNNSQLSFKIFHEFLEHHDGELAADVANKTSELPSQRSEPKAQQLHMAVDPDVMEFIITTSYQDELNQALSAKKCEIKWTPKNKTAIIVFRGDDKSDSMQSECLELVQNYLEKFAKCDVEIRKEFWEPVKTQLSDVRACLGVEPSLIKTLEQSFCIRIVCLISDTKSFEDQVKAKLEEIYREETRKTYLNFSKSISKERIILLKEIKFAEKLQQHNNELEITLDTEAEKIYFEGPQKQFKEAAMKFHKLDQNIVEKKLAISESILEVLGTDEGLQRLKRELEKNNVEAVFVIDNEVCIAGTTAAQADQAASLVGKLTSEEKIRVDETSKHLLKTSEWRQLCDELNTGEVVSVYQNNWSDTFVAGFREDVTEGVKKLNDFLENNCIRKELFSCPSKLIRRYLFECRQDDLRLIETQLASFEVKVENGKGEESFVISGNKEGLKRAREELNTFVTDVSCKLFDVKQPGLRKFYASGKGDLLEKSIEKNYECAILVQKSFDWKREEDKAQGAQTGSDSTSSDDDESVIGGDDDIYDEGEVVVRETDRSSFATKAGHHVSWRAGIIEAERVDILVSSRGACSKAILNAGGPAMRNSVTTPNTGHITVTPGFALPCNHVFHTNCSAWNTGIGEEVLRNIVQRCLQKGEELRMSSIAFPVIGTGKLNFPPNEASRIMLEEIFSFCQTNVSSTLKDIRFVVYQQDQALVTAFKQEMANLQSKHNLRQEYTTNGFFGKFQSKFGITTAVSSPGLSSEHGLVGPSNSKYTGPSIEVINADLTQETTDAILNINSTDMNMNNAGELSKAILKRGGPQIQQECSQQGNQVAGSAVMTNGGNLAAPKVIHIIPESKDTRHLQTCLEAGLRLADKHKLRSLSLPCVGTGAYGLSAVDSAQLTFQALNNFNVSCQYVRKVRIVVFKASMMQEFLQAYQRHSAREADHKLDSDSSSGHTRQLREYDRGFSLTNDPSIKICVAGKDATSVEKAVDSLKSGFSEACTTQKVENEAVNQLSHRQIESLRKKASDRDVRLDIEADIDRIVVRGGPTEVTGMVGEIWHEINERNKKIKEEQQALLVLKNIEWSYKIQGTKMVFGSKTNAKLEMAHVKSEAFVRVSLRADEFDINMKAKTGQGRYNGEMITIHRKVKGSNEGISLPKHWDPMPQPGRTVHLVPLAPGSSEYQTVASKFQSTAQGYTIQKIERVQNPHLYQSYVVRKQKMDQDNGGNNERQLFHGTDAKNVTAMNTQGFNRSFCGAHGMKYGRGVYFARDASYSARFTGRGVGSLYMYLARVLVGQYCKGNSAMIVPPPKDPSKPEILYDSVVDHISNPSIFVVFYDSQCYPEYLITFSYL
ncbi:protein mono-ADP-ribosyltransferase PARP14-like [Montipora foliosa]|uniref:protein mono-ADP-ribosyltransferase PARP14-like n=1 Tax=Montipora foliosa TaxID=591990 RepID=UPI0035F12E63